MKESFEKRILTGIINLKLKDPSTDMIRQSQKLVIEKFAANYEKD